MRGVDPYRSLALISAPCRNNSFVDSILSLFTAVNRAVPPVILVGLISTEKAHKRLKHSSIIVRVDVCPMLQQVLHCIKVAIFRCYIECVNKEG